MSYDLNAIERVTVQAQPADRIGAAASQSDRMATTGSEYARITFDTETEPRN
jgi:hypothetical protein